MSATTTEDHEPKRKKKGTGFFTLDIDQFDRIRTEKLGIEEAATYLCLLKSTDQGNVISSGGIDSVRRYSGLAHAQPLTHSTYKGNPTGFAQQSRLTVEVSGYKAFSEELQAPHLCFDAISLVIAAPVSPDSPTESAACPQSLVAGLRPWCGFLPGSAVTAGGDHGLGLAGGDGGVA